MLLSYKPLHLEAQQRLQEEGCVVDISRPRAASRKSMAIGSGKRKWQNAVGFASSLAAAAAVDLSVYSRDRRCHGIDAEELVQV